MAKDYEVTLKLEIFVTYGVEAWDDEQAEMEAMADALKDLPAGWDITASEAVEIDCPADHDTAVYDDK
jgi:hypothetical protein